MTSNLKPYLIGLTATVIISTAVLDSRLSNLSNQLSRIENNIKVDSVRKPASYISDGDRNYQIRLGLEVISETNIVLGNPEIKPPLRGNAYFCTTIDDVGYYVFTGTGKLTKGDEFEGWFNQTGLQIHHRDYDRNYSLITPVYIEKAKLKDLDSLNTSP
ncbi:hypothetical protein HYT23_06925 [Candidatus Pacearchaeota archaeon]|nr:hypothetical protein [Candidatus Pacearchaeota archaeon]